MIKKVFDFINKNGIISSLIASAIFSIIVYYANSDYKQLIYYEVLNEKIVDSKLGKGFKIYTSDNRLVKDNLFLLRLIIGNKGNVPIEKIDIKQNLIIKLDSSSIILNETKIIETHHKVTKANFKNHHNIIEYDFEFLEKKNIIQFDIYYTSKEKSNYNFYGYIAKSKTLIKNRKYDEFTLDIIGFPIFTLIIFILINLFKPIEYKLEKWPIRNNYSERTRKTIRFSIRIILYLILTIILLILMVKYKDYYYPYSKIITTYNNV